MRGNVEWLLGERWVFGCSRNELSCRIERATVGRGCVVEFGERDAGDRPEFHPETRRDLVFDFASSEIRHEGPGSLRFSGRRLLQKSLQQCGSAEFIGEPRNVARVVLGVGTPGDQIAQ